MNGKERGETPVSPVKNGSSGLTIREYLAGQALQGLLLTTPVIAQPGYSEEEAVKHADALLNELQKSEE